MRTVQIPVFLGGYANAFFEALAEVGRGGIPQLRADLADLQKAVAQELLCVLYSDSISVFKGGGARNLLKHTGKVEFTHTAHIGVVLKLQVAVVKSVHMLYGSGHTVPLLIFKAVHLYRFALYKCQQTKQVRDADELVMRSFLKGLVDYLLKYRGKLLSRSEGIDP